MASDNDLKSCLDMVMRKIKGTNATLDAETMSKKLESYIEKSPCYDLHENPDCETFCTHQQKLFEKLTKKDILAMLRYTQSRHITIYNFKVFQCSIDIHNHNKRS